MGIKGVKPVILYITHGFPYDMREVFTADEFSYMQQLDADIFAFPRLGAPSPSLICPASPVLLPHFFKKILALLSFEAVQLLYQEYVATRQYTAPFNAIAALKAIAIALQAKSAVRYFILKNNLERRPLVIYAFWFSEAVYGLSLLKKEFPHVRIVSRAHRGDLYFEACRNQFLPFRFLRYKYVDIVAPCSQEGCNVFLRERFLSAQVRKSYLGVPRPLTLALPSEEEQIHIVSVSAMIGVKRLHLLISALATLAKERPTLSITWHHLGDGPENAQLRQQASNVLGFHPNIAYTFHGQMPVEKVRRFLIETQPLDALINVSESEGVPVSMMEAIAAGLPILATDVGGVNEIVNEITGILIPKAFTHDQFIAAVEAIVAWKTPQKRKEVAAFFVNNFFKVNANKNCGLLTAETSQSILLHDILRQIESTN